MNKFLVVIGLLCFAGGGYAAPQAKQKTAPAEKSSPAPTSPRDTYYSSGYYLGLNMGQARANLADKPGYQKQETGFASSAYFGYDFNHYLAIELGYLYLPTAKYTDGPAGSDVNITNHGFATNVLGKYPVGEGFSVYAKVGGAILKAKQTGGTEGDKTQNATVLAYGGGIDYVFANVGGLHLDLDYYHTNKKNSKTVNVPAENIASVGIRYQF